MIPPITTSPLQITNGISYSLRRIVWANTSIVDVCAVHTDYGQLLVLAADGSLSGVDFETGIITSLSKVALPEFNPTEGNEHFGMQALRLHASSNGKYAAIVIDFGRPGIVVEIRSGAVLMHLDGGDYCEETVPFGICFVHHNGRDVLVHRTAWNRLDVSDLASGELLTARDIAPYVSGGSRPEHYLDYFHGRLLPSPDGGRIFDDGWVWHPVSMPCAWSLTEWLNSNLWESEDGSSRVTLMSCDDWNKPACWIDEQHIALWGERIGMTKSLPKRLRELACGSSIRLPKSVHLASVG